MTAFLVANWVWIAFVIAMLAMHRRGGCGMHSHQRHPGEVRGAGREAELPEHTSHEKKDAS